EVRSAFHGRLLARLPDAGAPIHAVAISPDGLRVATGGALKRDRGENYFKNQHLQLGRGGLGAGSIPPSYRRMMERDGAYKLPPQLPSMSSETYKGGLVTIWDAGTG